MLRSSVLVGLALIAIVLGAVWMRGPAALPAAVQPASTPASAADVPLASPPVAADVAPASSGLTATSRASEDEAPTPAPPIVPTGTALAPIEDVVSRIMPAVVLVETSAGRGSGFFVAPDTLLTNVHVVGRNSSVTIHRMDGATIAARVEALSPEFDIAVLKTVNPDPRQAVIALGSALSARVGQDVIAIGSALGTLQNTVTRGIVSALRQSGNATLVQTDAAINPGNSGGPLLDRAGQAIGITTMGYSGRQGLSFAVAADHARALLERRPMPAPPAPARSAEMRSLSPALPSETEEARAVGTKVFEQALAQLARQAQLLDDYWGRFRSSCYEGRVASAGLDHDWFALFEARAMQGTVSPGCGAYLADVKQRAADIRNGVIAAEEVARQADVFPGVRRELRRKHRLEGMGIRN